MTRFFDKYPMEHKPTFSDKVGRRRGATIIPVPHLDILTWWPVQYIIFRRGVGIDQVTDYFWMQKLDLLLESLWATFMWCLW